MRLFFLFLLRIVYIQAKAVKGSGEPLFAKDHENITYLTDQNFDSFVVTNEDKRPWLIDYYHPFCPHCISFVPDWIAIAAYYKKLGTIQIGAVSCMDHVKCRRVGIDGFPTLIGYNFNPLKPGEDDRIVGTHTIKEVTDFVDQLTAGGAGNATAMKEAMKLETTPPVTLPVTIWEQSTLPSDHNSRMADAATAFIFGLKQGIFTGREILEDMHLDALKEWLRVVSLTFPGSFHRKLIRQLYDKVQPLPFLHVDEWEPMLSAWQESTVEQYTALDIPGNVEVPEWQRNGKIFAGQGNEYVACALYTCGQWNMFHMMTVNPTGIRDEELLVAVVGAIRRFMKYFFGCIECRKHFLQENTIKMVQELHRAKRKDRLLKIWLWRMHNSVNQRLGHPLWPKANICENCGTVGGWNERNVLVWLVEWYGYQEVDIYSKRRWTHFRIVKPSPTFDTISNRSDPPTEVHILWVIIPLGILASYIKMRYSPSKKGRKGHMSE